MAAAAIMGHLVTLVRLPPIVGFLVAGVIIGPATPGPIADLEIAGQLAELGVILLMFGVGIHFSVRDLLDVQSIALPGACIQAALMTGIVILATRGLGWSLGSGLLVGLALAIASTVIVVHSLTERNEINTLHGRIAVGWLIVEDLITVFVLVLVPAISGAGNDGGISELSIAILLTLGKIALLSVVMIVVGTRIVPRLLIFSARTGSRELFLLTTLAIALGIAYISATVFDVSLALGAFLAGLVVSEADLSHQAAADALPFQDAFAVLFFVSVGMLLEPEYILEEPVLTIFAVVLIVAVKPLLTWILLVILRFPSGPGLTIAASRAQIGEFSFILASLGLSVGVLDNDHVNLILVGSIISILISPYAFNVSEFLQHWLQARPELIQRIDRPEPLHLTGVDGEEEPQFRRHAVLMGYGRVGSVIGEALRRRGFSLVVVEQNRRIVDELREQGIPVINGDASNPLLLEQLNLPRARVLIVALSDPIAARLAVERARKLAPNLPIVVRTHSEAERHYYNQLGNGEAVIGERELAIEMARFALHRFGVPTLEIQAILRGIRFREEEEEETTPRITDPIS